MEYEFYIDESGSINQKKRGIFEIALLLIPTPNTKKIKKFYNKKFNNFKKINGIIQNIELKAHFLKENNFLNFIDFIFHSFLKNNRVLSAYVDNKDLRSESNSEDLRFFQMIEFIIQRCIDRGYLKEGDTLKIFADQRNNLIKNILQLKRKTSSIYGIELLDFIFLDSRTNVLIQIADIVSFKCNRLIIESLKNKTRTPEIPNLSFRKVYY